MAVFRPSPKTAANAAANETSTDPSLYKVAENTNACIRIAKLPHYFYAQIHAIAVAIFYSADLPH
jgi:hypothetical protein